MLLYDLKVIMKRESYKIRKGLSIFLKWICYIVSLNSFTCISFTKIPVLQFEPPYILETDR